jgi:hypothetical protein
MGENLVGQLVHYLGPPGVFIQAQPQLDPGNLSKFRTWNLQDGTQPDAIDSGTDELHQNLQDAPGSAPRLGLRSKLSAQDFAAITVTYVCPDHIRATATRVGAADAANNLSARFPARKLGKIPGGDSCHFRKKNGFAPSLCALFGYGS